MKSKRIFWISLLMVLVVFTAACSNSSDGTNTSVPGTYQLNVSVKGPGDESIDADVKVFKGDNLVFEKSGSQVQFKDLEKGTYTVKVENANYELWTEEVSITGDLSITAELAAKNDEENLVSNGDFSEELLESTNNGASVLDTEGTWQLALNSDSAAGTATLEDGQVKADIIAGAGRYSVQLLNAPINLERGSKYKVSMKAKSDGAIKLVLGGGADVGYSKYVEKDYDLTDNMKTYEFEFEMELATNENTRLELWLQNNTTYYFDDIKVIKTGERDDLAEPGTLTEEDENEVENWELVWDEQFEEIDPNIWSFQNGNGTDYGVPLWGNREQQWYQEENATIEDASTVGDSNATDGNYLVITAKDISDDPIISGGGRPFEYSSARLTTKPNNFGNEDAEGKTFKYGKIEMRAKLPEGEGIWPAFWMLGHDDKDWPYCGEIDIMELVGDEPATVHGTLHTGHDDSGDHPLGKGYTLESGKFSDDFHTFTLEWDENELEWYVDGTLYHVANKHELMEEDWTFNDDFYLLLNVAVGGHWPGMPDETTVFPQSMAVDYIKVYEDTNPDSITGEEVWEADYEQPENDAEPDTEPSEPDEDSEYYFISEDQDDVDVTFGTDNTSDDGDISVDGWSTGTEINEDVTYADKACWSATKPDSWGTVIALMGDLHGEDEVVADYPVDVSTYDSIEISIATSADNSFAADDLRMKLVMPDNEPEFSLTEYGFDPAATGWQQISIPLSDFSADNDLSTMKQIAIFALGGETGVDKYYVTNYYLKEN